MRIAAKVELSEAQREQLETWAKGRMVPVRLAERAKMILLRGAGQDGQRDRCRPCYLARHGGTLARSVYS